MQQITRRTLVGGAILGSGLLLSGFGFKNAGQKACRIGRWHLDGFNHISKGLKTTLEFPLVDAIQGRRSRRFALGANLLDGPLAYTSKHSPQPLSELQQMLLLTSITGNTGWSHLIPYNRNYLPNIPNYAGSASGRPFPSAAGFHTTELFFTDDKGTYFLPTADMEPLTDKKTHHLKQHLDHYKSRIQTLSSERLNIPKSPLHMEMHNEWCANVSGSTLIIPVADLAQHAILNLCYLVQNGACIYDDVHNQPIPGLSEFSDMVDLEAPYPLSYMEQIAVTEVTVEISTALHNGALMLQAMGLGGWMYEGLNPFSVLGASGDSDVPGLGFDFHMTERSPLPNVTGLPGVFEGHCPPHFDSMADAVDSVIERKFGEGGPFNDSTPGPYKSDNKVRGAAAKHNKRFRDCVVLMAEYIYERFNKFPATVPSIFTMMYLQAHKLDTDYYDKHFDEGAYLRTHAHHLRDWEG